MGTEKRQRQKANRQQKLIEEQRAERTALVKRNVVRWGLAGILAVGAVVLIAWVGGAFSSDEEATPPTLAPVDTTPVDTTPVDTTPPVTYPTPDKPEVSIPDETPTELVVTVLKPGDGPEAAVGDTVVVHYVGVRTEDGTEFDNSYDRGQPFPVVVGQGSVIAGWDQGLVGAQKGEQLQLDIPADLAYGDNPRGDVIQPGDALTFVIDVMDVIPAASS